MAVASLALEAGIRAVEALWPQITSSDAESSTTPLRLLPSLVRLGLLTRSPSFTAIARSASLRSASPSGSAASGEPAVAAAAVLSAANDGPANMAPATGAVAASTRARRAAVLIALGLRCRCRPGAWGVEGDSGSMRTASILKFLMALWGSDRAGP